MADDDIHGTRLAGNRHYAAGEPLCAACADFDNDRQRAQRLLTGKGSQVRITAVALGRILRGWPPERALAGEVGPQLWAALVQKAGERRA
jgi:hypothetical protein